MLLDVCGETACEHDKLNGHGGHILKGPGLTNRQKRLSRVRRCGVAWCGPGRMISSPRPSRKAKTCKKRPDTWTVCGRKYYTIEGLRTRAWMMIEWHIRRVHRALQRSRQGRGRGTKCGTCGQEVLGHPQRRPDEEHSRVPFLPGSAVRKNARLLSRSNKPMGLS